MAKIHEYPLFWTQNPHPPESELLMEDLETLDVTITLQTPLPLKEFDLAGELKTAYSPLPQIHPFRLIWAISLHVQDSGTLRREHMPLTYRSSHH